ncbi:MAG: hypothetical protein HQ494_07195 [Rhodospirillales bacterium]|nr:hypothetical protein [Rhodospirillales bacterium]
MMELSPRIIPFITVVDVGYQPLAFTYRFWGTGQTQVKGHDFTGKSPLAHIPKEHGELIFREYEIVTERKEPAAFIRGIHPKDYSPSKIQETLRLPLSDDGETINHVVSFADWRTDMELWKQMYKRMYKRMSDH